MATSELSIRFIGTSGDGVLTAGDVFSLTACRSGYHAFLFNSYPAEVRGDGESMSQVRVSVDEIYSQGDGLSTLIDLRGFPYAKDIKELRRHGVAFFDGEGAKPSEQALMPSTTSVYGIPFSKISINVVGNPRSKNIVALGALAKAYGLSLDILREAVREKFKSKGEILQAKVLAALDAGYQYVEKELIATRRAQFPQLTPSSMEPMLLMSGNQALCLGAIAAGCRFYAGYPITPASSILEFLAVELPKYGGIAVQTEDEMAAIGAVLGASFAGQKAMTATSGPGFSLMCETLNLAAMAEIPCVVVDAQRGGPSTGLPTKTEQSDLNIALYGAHGDSPRIVVAPATVEDCFYVAVQAFNLAERYQLPVIILTDQFLGQRKETIKGLDFNKVEMEHRVTPDYSKIKKYERYMVTKDGVSPMAIPGQEGGGHVATGIEHREDGEPNYDSETHLRMTQKRFQKLLGVQQRIDSVETFGDASDEVVVVGWGSTWGSVKEAVLRARAEGVKVAALHTKFLNPLPDVAIEDFLRVHKHVIIPEINYTGQFANLMRSRYRIRPIQLDVCEGRPLSPHEIYSKIKEVA